MSKRRRRKRKLKLVSIEPAKPLKDLKPRNFWNTCPRQLDLFPTIECEMGKQSAILRSNNRPPCEWSINCEKSHYCFWKWVHMNSKAKGTMRPLMQNEIAKYGGCSSTKIHFILKSAISKLKKGNYAEILAELCETINKNPESPCAASPHLNKIENNE